MGVFPFSASGDFSIRRLPHARGGVSTSLTVPESLLKSSPRTWGCFPMVPRCAEVRDVFPTHVGVFLRCLHSASERPRLPHARGGVSAELRRLARENRSSPRTWGCFKGMGVADIIDVVFPTHVGVFLAVGLDRVGDMCLPHARGGVSLKQSEQAQPSESSPRTWGCFWPRCRTERHGLVFPTHVGVFLA